MGILLRSAIATVLALFVVAGPARASNANPCGGDHTFAYAGQNTATGNGAGECPDNLAYTYYGVDGQIETPPALAPIASGDLDHSAGYLAAWFNTANTSWVQIGWMMGKLGNGVPGTCAYDSDCLYSWNQYLLYYERHTSGGGYLVKHYGSLSLSGLVTYRITQSAGCWYTYRNYNVQVDKVCSGLAPSGAMVAANETHQGTTYYKGMPLSNFGSATPNTNQTLRIRPGSTWTDWTSATNTFRVESRPDFFHSLYAYWYHFLTYGAVR